MSYRTGEWIIVKKNDRNSIHLVLMERDEVVTTTMGMTFSSNDISLCGTRRMCRFILAKAAVDLLTSARAEFVAVKPGMVLLVLVPPASSDLKNYELAKLVTVAVKDSDRKLLFDQDGEQVDFANSFFLDETAEPGVDGFLNETGIQVVEAMYS